MPRRESHPRGFYVQSCNTGRLGNYASRRPRAVESEVEDIKRRPALEDEPRREDRIAGDLLQQVQEPRRRDPARLRNARRP